MTTTTEIPKGRTKEVIQKREQILNDFFACWLAANPEKRIYNVNYQAFIYLDYCPFTEIARKIARSCQATKEITCLTEILALANHIGIINPKEDMKIHHRFSHRLYLHYPHFNTRQGWLRKPSFGKILSDG
jgi:hypothetical protein